MNKERKVIMPDDIYKSALLKAIDETLIVSVEQFGMTDLNKERNIAEVYRLNASLTEAVNASPPEKSVRSVYFRVEKNTVTDIKYEYADDPLPLGKTAIISDNEWTEGLTKNYFYSKK